MGRWFECTLLRLFLGRARRRIVETPLLGAARCRSRLIELVQLRLGHALWFRCTTRFFDSSGLLRDAPRVLRPFTGDRDVPVDFIVRSHFVSRRCRLPRTR